MTKANKWGLVHAPEGGVMGVYSLSEERPFKQDNFRERDRAFVGKTQYSEWQFVYVPVK
jgi:hypothetical protein